MDLAREVVSAVVWSSRDFSALPAAEIERLRRSLECVECREFAWFRSSSERVPAHFCAHHSDQCSLRVRYNVVPSDDASDEDRAVQDNEGRIVIRLDQQRPRPMQHTPARVHDNDAGDVEFGGRTAYANGRREGELQATLRLILHRLVHGRAFAESGRILTLYRNENELLIEGAVSDVVCGFDSITPDRHDSLALYWGAVASAGRTQDGKVWLNFSSVRSGASVSIYEDISQDFLDSFGIDDLEDLVGAHVLVFGRCFYAATGKPVVRCGAVKNIVVRRYRSQA